MTETKQSEGDFYRGVLDGMKPCPEVAGLLQPDTRAYLVLERRRWCLVLWRWVPVQVFLTLGGARRYALQEVTGRHVRIEPLDAARNVELRAVRWLLSSGNEASGDAAPQPSQDQLRSDAVALAQAIESHTKGWPFTLCKGDAAEAYKRVIVLAPPPGQEAKQ